MGFTCAFAASADEVEPHKRVLFLSSYHPGFPTFFSQVDGLRKGLAEKGFNEKNLILDIEFLDAKRFAPDAAVRGTAACSEVLGAYGWLHDHPIARMAAVATMLTVVDGTAEVQRIVIARDLQRRASK